MADPVQLIKKIRAAFAPRSLGEWPTPLERAPTLAAAAGLAELTLKREDRASTRYGGNKLRGLEFLFAGVPPGTVFVTVGSIGSTHCLATAVHAARVQCRAAIAQFPQPETPISRTVGAATAARAALVVRARGRVTLPLAVVEAWHRARLLGRRRWIPGGGAHPCAVPGHVIAGLELAQQVIEPPDEIVLPLGTGATAAGVVLAVAALDWPTRVVAVRVAPAVVANRWRTLRLARGARHLLADRGVALPAPRSLEVVHALGRGYGWPTAEGEAARALAAGHGITLDHTYGAKAFAVLVRRTGDVQRVVFWHTFALPNLPDEPAA